MVSSHTNIVFSPPFLRTKTTGYRKCSHHGVYMVLPDLTINEENAGNSCCTHREERKQKAAFTNQDICPWTRRDHPRQAMPAADTRAGRSSRTTGNQHSNPCLPPDCPSSKAVTPRPSPQLTFMTSEKTGPLGRLGRIPFTSPPLNMGFMFHTPSSPMASIERAMER